MPPIWRVRLFGQVRVEGRGQIIQHFESRRAAALLAHLALHPDTAHPREVLADKIWPDAPLEAGRNRLKQALASLRRQLEPPDLEPGSVLCSARHTITLRGEAVSCDVLEFRLAVARRDYARARELRAGDLMPGFYDDWLEDIRLDLSAYDEEFWDEEPTLISVQTAPEVPSFEVRIPVQVTSFVGRDDETRQVLESLELNRLVTITGLGGFGKTRLSQQVGRCWGKGPVWFVPLESLDSCDQVLPMAASSMGLDLAHPQGLEAAISGAVGRHPALIVLDNAEQLVSQPLAALLLNLLESAPSLRLLVTSRRPLRVQDGAEIALHPLELPAADASLEELAANPTVRLFVDRARQVRPDYQVTPNNHREISEICQQLDGIPLAIELCAAWSHFGAKKILERLRSDPDLLVSRKQGDRDRHKSLHRVMASALSTLSPEAHALLRQVSILRGGWDLDLAAALQGEALSLDIIHELLDASLIKPTYTGETPRFGWLETLRQQVEESLSEPESDQLWERASTLFLAAARASMAAAPMPALGAATQADWIDILTREWRNIRAAGARMRKQGDARGLTELAWNTEWYWSHYSGDPEFVRSLAAMEGVNDIRAKLLIASHLTKGKPLEEIAADFANIEAQCEDDPELAGQAALRWCKICVLRQSMEGVRELAERAAASFEAAGDDSGLGQALHVLANHAIQDGKEEEALRSLDRCEDILRKGGQQIHLAAVLYTRARLHYMHQRWEECLPILYACRTVGRSMKSHRFLGRTANLFGVVYRNLKLEPQARVHFFLSAISAANTLDMRALHFPLWNLFCSLGADCRWAEAVPVMGCAMDIYEEHLRVPLEEEDQAILDDFCHGAAEALGAAEFARLRNKGIGLSAKQAIAVVERTLQPELSEFQEDVLEFKF